MQRLVDVSILAIGLMLGVLAGRVIATQQQQKVAERDLSCAQDRQELHLCSVRLQSCLVQYAAVAEEPE